MKISNPKKVGGIGAGTKIIVSVVVLCGVYFGFIKNDKESTTKPTLSGFANEELVSIPVLLEGVKAGSSLKDAEYVLKPFSQKESMNFIKTPKELERSIAKIHLQANEPISLKAVITKEVEDKNAEVEIPKGMRAITISTLASKADMIEVGTKFDITVRKRSYNRDGESTSKIIGENLRVIKKTEKKSNVILSVLANENDVLKMTEHNPSDYTFLIRNENDNAPLQVRATNPPKQELQKKQKFVKGYAKGPDGSAFVLTEDKGSSNWMGATKQAADYFSNIGNRPFDQESSE